jgi:PRTRC genetic system protein A
MTLDPRDAALRATCPCVSMPMFSALDPIGTGQRMVLGRNGLFLQLKTPWLDCTTLVADMAGGLVLAYGEVKESLAFEFGVIPLGLLDQFIEQARALLPREAAGALIFDERDGALDLRMHEALDAGAGHIRYRIADLAAHEVIAVDLHTHGRLPAFWSRDDDRDDQGVRICGVFGHLDRGRPSAKFRLVMNGLFRALPSPWEPGEARGPEPGTSASILAPKGQTWSM